MGEGAAAGLEPAGARQAKPARDEPSAHLASGPHTPEQQSAPPSASHASALSQQVAFGMGAQLPYAHVAKAVAMKAEGGSVREIVMAIKVAKSTIGRALSPRGPATRTA